MTTKAIFSLISLIFTLHPICGLFSMSNGPNTVVYEHNSLSRESPTEHQDPRENIKAKFNTCDFDLVQLLNDESIISEFSEQCQTAYRDVELKELLLRESQLFQQINEKIGAYERLQDPECDPFEEGRENPCPTIDYELRLQMHNVTDIMTCQNSTGHYEFADCMVQKRNEMLDYLNEIL